MNFIEEFIRGQSGSNKGIPFGPGLTSLTRDINGLVKKRIIAIAGAEKSGKTTLADYATVIQPYLYHLKTGFPVSWVYYTYEIDRISKEFDYMCFFLNHDFGIDVINLPEGVTKDGLNYIHLSPAYLKGQILDDSDNFIKVDPSLIDKIKVTYSNRIEPLFGSYYKNGTLKREGLIKIRDKADNPTGIYKDLINIASQKGKLTQDLNGRYILYEPNDPNEITIVVLDHVRKLIPERGYQLKQTIDKMGEYMVILRNLLGFTFIPIIHTNRNLASSDKIMLFKGDLYPTSDDVKDSGNIGEDCDYLITVFNPNDDKYRLDTHFDVKLRDSKKNILFPYLKTIHLVSSRHSEFPRHYAVNMYGGIKKFEQFK